MRLRFIPLCAAGLLLALTSAEARQKFDGNWSIDIIGEPGRCEFGYRIPIEIDEGAIFYKGRMVNREAVGLNRAGAVAIRLTSGPHVVTGRGSLRGDHGGGEWDAPSIRCSGKWKAERH